jgi:hypothetical protein
VSPSTGSSQPASTSSAELAKLAANAPGTEGVVGERHARRDHWRRRLGCQARRRRGRPCPGRLPERRRGVRLAEHAEGRVAAGSTGGRSPKRFCIIWFLVSSSTSRSRSPLAIAASSPPLLLYSTSPAFLG